MTISDKLAKAGTLLCIDRGAYSSYEVLGFFVVLEDFSPATELARHFVERREQARPFLFQSDIFLAALIKRGLVLEIPYATLHLENYGKVENFSFTPACEEQEP